MNPDPLEISLNAQRPIHEAPLQPLVVELLLRESPRRLIDLARLKYETQCQPDRDADLEGLIQEIRRERNAA